MPVSYAKLFERMTQKGIKKIDLRNTYKINPKTVDSLVNNRSVTVDTIIQLCEILDCQPGDIMEYVRESDVSEKGWQVSRTVLAWFRAVIGLFFSFQKCLWNQMFEWTPPGTISGRKKIVSRKVVLRGSHSHEMTFLFWMTVSVAVADGANTTPPFGYKRQ